jgi:PPM family protein phosphatase
VKKAEPAAIPATATTDAAPARKAPRTLPAKRGSGLTWFLLFLSLLLGVLAWYFYRQAQGKARVEDGPTGAQVQRSPEEQRLLDSLNLAPVFFLDSSFGRSIDIHDTLLFRGDSVRIYGNGQVLRADSNYAGPGLAMTGNGRYLMLDNIVLEGFDIGLLVPSGSLQLKNVQFRNCRIPVQYAIHLPEGRFISGSFSDSLVFKRDTAFRR